MNIFSIGLTQDSSEEAVRYVTLTNQIALSFICLASPYFFVFYLLELPFQAYMVIPSVISYGVCILLNRFHLYKLASFSVILFTSVIILYYSCVLGKPSGAHYVMFALVLMPLMIIPIGYKGWLLASFGIPTSALISMELTHYRIFKTLPLGESSTDIISFFASLTTLSIIICATFFYHLSRNLAQKKEREANAQLVDAYEQLKLIKKRMDAELAVAKTIQSNLLPKMCPSPTGMHIDAFMQPAFEVGGDYYDFFEFSDTEIGILLIDIVGKSIPSCLHMVTIKSVIHRNINEKDSPSEFLRTLNLELIKDPVFTKYVPVFYAKLDTKNKTFTYCNGGHEPAIWHSNKTNTLLTENDGVLGMFDDTIFHDTTLQLSSEDKLILFTDGLSDLKDINEESFTETPLTSALEAYTPHPNRSLSEFIYISALTVCEKQPKDDITILTVQVA